MEEKGKGEGVQCLYVHYPELAIQRPFCSLYNTQCAYVIIKKNPLNLEWNGVLFGLNSSDVMVRLLIQKSIRFYFYLVSCRKTKKT